MFGFAITKINSFWFPQGKWWHDLFTKLWLSAICLHSKYQWSSNGTVKLNWVNSLKHSLVKKILWKSTARKANGFNIKLNFENVIDKKLTIVPPKVIWQIVVRFLEFKETHGFHMIKNRTFINRKLPPFQFCFFDLIQWCLPLICLVLLHLSRLLF